MRAQTSSNWSAGWVDGTLVIRNCNSVCRSTIIQNLGTLGFDEFQDVAQTQGYLLFCNLKGGGYVTKATAVKEAICFIVRNLMSIHIGLSVHGASRNWRFKIWRGGTKLCLCFLSQTFNYLIFCNDGDAIVAFQYIKVADTEMIPLAELISCHF